MGTSNGTTTKHTYVLLDGMRGVAAIAVAILHMPRVFGGVTMPNAHLAVDFFLQLSGFIVAYAYAERIRAGMSFSDFTRRRFSRLYPAYLVGFLLGVLVALSAIAFSGNGLSVDWTPLSLVCSAIFNGVMLPQPYCGGESLLFPLNPPMWTIFYEVILNLLFFVAAALLLKWRNSLILAAVALVATVLLTSPTTLDIGYAWPTFFDGFVRLAFSFLIGIAIYGLSIGIRRTSNLVSILLLTALAVVLAVQLESYVFEIVAVLVVFPTLIVFGSMYNPSWARLSWTLTQLGLLSYVLYVIHKPLYQLLYAATLRLTPDAVAVLGPALGVVMLGLICVVAWLLAKHYEPWARRLLETLLGARRAARRVPGQVD